MASVKKQSSTGPPATLYAYHHRPKISFRRIARMVKLILKVFVFARKSVKKGRIHGLGLQELAKQEISQLHSWSSVVSLDVRNTLSKPPWARTASECKQAHEELASCEPLNDYPSHILRRMCKVGWHQSLHTGRVITKAGYPANFVFFLLTGTVESTPNTAIDSDKEIYTAGSCFGEEEIIRSTHRAATCVVKEQAELFLLSKSDYFDFSVRQARLSYQRNKHFAFCKTIGMLKAWPISVLEHQATACRVEYYKTNAVVVKDSLHSAWIYIVMTGSCRVVKSFVDDVGKKLSSGTYDDTQTDKQASAAMPHLQGKKQFLVQLQILQPKDIFGLSSLVHDKQPSVTLVSNGAELIMLPKEFISKYLSEALKTKLRRQVIQYPSEQAMRKRIKDHHTWNLYKQQTAKT